jgi:hypothetical protein
MKRIINYDLLLGDFGGGSPKPKPICHCQFGGVLEAGIQIPQGCESHTMGQYSYACGCVGIPIGYCHVPNCRYGQAIDGNYGQGSYGNQGQDGQMGNEYNVYTGLTQTHTEGDYPVASYTEDVDVYRRHLYREELKTRGLKGIGLNDFDLLPTVNRNDREICIEIVNKFKEGNMATKFEDRLHSALLRKKEIDEQKTALLKRLNVRRETAKSKFDERLEKMRQQTNRTSGFESFINELKDERFKNLDETEYLEQIKQDNIVPPKPKVPEKTDDNRVDYYVQVVLSSRNYYGVHPEQGKEVDGLRYYDFTFRPAVDENSTELDIFVELGGKAIEFEEKSSNEMIRELKDDDTVPNAVGNFLGKFTKKKTFVKKIRVKYDNILKASKEKYG